MREKLYLTISKFSIRSLFYDYFMFFDTTPYLADQLFIRHEVRVSSCTAVCWATGRARMVIPR